MSSTNRNPKELKELIEKTKTRAIEWKKDETTAIVQAKKFISKSELEVLNSRLEEQARLILYYKQRGDDYMQKCSNLEKLNQYLVEQKPFKFFRIDHRLLKGLELL
jgi:hypothetical protein